MRPERRERPRTLCPIRHKLAVYRPGLRPSELEFQDVTLYDLSAGGFSFWAPDWPESADFVFPVSDPEPVFVLASVRNAETLTDRLRVLHCKFVRRLSDEPDPSDPPG